MKKKLIIITGIILLSIFIGAEVSQAYSIPDQYRPINDIFGGNIVNEDSGLSSSDIAIIILQIVAGALLYFAAPIAIIMLALAGFNIVMGGADSEKITEAKKHIQWIIMGLILIMLSYVLVRTIVELTINAAELDASPPPPTGGEPVGDGGAGADSKPVPDGTTPNSAGPLDNPNEDPTGSKDS